MERNAIIRALEQVEEFLYRQSEHIVVVTESFKDAIVDKGISPDDITVIKNGVDLHWWNQPLDQAKLSQMRERLGLQGKFVASYIGTIGMAHRADVLLEAAQRCSDLDVVFMVVGTGAQRGALEARQRELQLDNFRLVDKVPKEEVPYLLALTDASVIHLRKSPLFETVIPSKMFEAMATRTPIILGVQGEAKALIEEANAGIPMTPEDPDALVEAVRQLKFDEDLRSALANDAYRYVKTHYARERLAHTYTERLRDVLASAK
jgi:glycosyltransferase involved in cell wall biosynthesis